MLGGVATVTRISIAPVKALGLVFPDEVELGPHGVSGDRRFWLVDADGRLFDNKRCDPRASPARVGRAERTPRALGPRWSRGRGNRRARPRGRPCALRRPVPGLARPWALERALTEFAGEPLLPSTKAQGPRIHLPKPTQPQQTLQPKQPHPPHPQSLEKSRPHADRAPRVPPQLRRLHDRRRHQQQSSQHLHGPLEYHHHPSTATATSSPATKPKPPNSSKPGSNAIGRK